MKALSDKQQLCAETKIKTIADAIAAQQHGVTATPVVEEAPMYDEKSGALINPNWRNTRRIYFDAPSRPGQFVTSYAVFRVDKAGEVGDELIRLRCQDAVLSAMEEAGYSRPPDTSAAIDRSKEELAAVLVRLAGVTKIRKLRETSAKKPRR